MNKEKADTTQIYNNKEGKQNIIKYKFDRPGVIYRERKRNTYLVEFLLCIGRRYNT